MLQPGQPLSPLLRYDDMTSSSGGGQLSKANLPRKVDGLVSELFVFNSELLSSAENQKCLIPNRLIRDCLQSYVLASRFTGATTSVSSMGGSVSFETFRAKVVGNDFSAVLAALQEHKAEFLDYNRDAAAIWRMQGVIDFDSKREAERAISALSDSSFSREATLPLGNGNTRLFIAENGRERSGLIFQGGENFKKQSYLEELDINEYSTPQILRVTDLNEEYLGFAAKLQLAVLLTRVNPQMTLYELDSLTVSPNDLFVAVRVPKSSELPPVICGCAVLENDIQLSQLTEFTDWIVTGSPVWNQRAGVNLLQEAVRYHRSNYPDLNLYGEFNVERAQYAALNRGFTTSHGRMHLHVPIDGVLANFEVLQYREN